MLKHKRHFTLLFLVVFFLTSCNSFTLSEEAKFDAYTREIFTKEVQSDTLSLNYSLADPSKYGIDSTPVSLGEYTVEVIKKSMTETEEYIKKLKKFNYSKLTPSQQISYDILENFLDLNLKYKDYIYYQEALGPTTGIQAQLPILLAEYNFYTKKDITTYLELLPSVYNYFEDISQFEREKSTLGLFMSDRVADRIIEQCEAFIENPEDNFLIRYFDEKVASYEGLTQKEISSYQAKNKEHILNHVIPAYRLLIDTLTELKGTGINDAGLYYYPDGQSYYELEAIRKTGSGRDLDEIARLLDQTVGDYILKITRLSMDDKEILNKLNDFSSFPITDPEEILMSLQQTITADFPNPIDVQCSIKYVDDSLSEYLSPAMYLVPALDNYTNNNIYINGNDEETLSTIFTTVAHEGYPGHLYQNVYFRSLNPAPIRNLLHFNGYSEGWATYAEHYSYRISGIDENLADFLSANQTIVLAMYARADIGIHYEGWNKTTAIRYINTIIGDADTALLIYETLLEEPGIYLPYAVGYLEITELREKAEETLGDKFDVKAFHKFILEFGPAQFNVIEKYMDQWMKTYVSEK